MGKSPGSRIRFVRDSRISDLGIEGSLLRVRSQCTRNRGRGEERLVPIWEDLGPIPLVPACRESRLLGKGIGRQLSASPSTSASAHQTVVEAGAYSQKVAARLIRR